MKTIAIYIVMGLLCLGVGYSQEIQITGTVIDKNTGEPLPGVNVLVKGTDIGTVTDFNGKYTIMASSGEVLVFSFIGFITREIDIADKIVIDMTLEEDYTALEEVVVVGYGTVSKSDVCCSVTSISTSEPRIIMRGERSGRSTTSRRSESVLEGKAAGIEVHKSDATRVTTYEPKVTAGILTAGELQDFSKWDLWADIADTYLSDYQKSWQIVPLNRYMVQIMFENGVPAIDSKVELLSSKGKIIWTARTDNTGKAELWVNLFNDTINDANDCKIVVYWDGQTYEIEEPTEFKKGCNNITIPVECEIPDVLEAVFVVDATSSMSDEIQYLKEELKYVINKVEEDHSDLSISLGSVFYRDEGDTYVTRKSDLSTDISQTYSFINSESSGGGGDYPEAVDQALDVAINEMEWSDNARARLLFLVLDAPPHEKPSIIKKIQRLSAEAAAKGIKIIPIASSGINKSTEYLLRSLALTTNGTYLFLTDHSGVGGAHIKPSTDKYDVNLLNNLLLKVFYQYTYAPSCDCQQYDPSKMDTFQLDVITTVVLDSVAIQQEMEAEVDTTQNNTPELKNDVDEPKEEDASDIISQFMNVEEQKGMKVYPNPSRGLINLEIKKDITEVYFADISGKLLERFDIEEDQTQQVDISRFSSGIYFIRYQNKENWYAEKIVLVH